MYIHRERSYRQNGTVCDLGVFIEHRSRSMKTHMQLTASRCFATLRQLQSIRRYIPTSVFQSLVSALVLSRLDYCNSLLIDLPLIHVQCLQSVHNAAARLIFNPRCCDHITDALISHHLAPRAATNYIQRGDADVPCTARLCTTICVADMPHRRRLGSASTERLGVSTFRRSTVGGRAFPVAGAKAWNGLPSDVTSASSRTRSKRTCFVPPLLRN